MDKPLDKLMDIFSTFLLFSALVSPPPDIQIKSLIQRLGSPTFVVREQAVTELASIGYPALGALYQAGYHKDIEVQDRARRLVQFYYVIREPDELEDIFSLPRNGFSVGDKFYQFDLDLYERYYKRAYWMFGYQKENGHYYYDREVGLTATRLMYRDLLYFGMPKDHVVALLAEMKNSVVSPDSREHGNYVPLFLDDKE